MQASRQSLHVDHYVKTTTTASARTPTAPRAPLANSGAYSQYSLCKGGKCATDSDDAALRSQHQTQTCWSQPRQHCTVRADSRNRRRHQSPCTHPTASMTRCVPRHGRSEREVVFPFGLCRFRLEACVAESADGSPRVAVSAASRVVAGGVAGVSVRQVSYNCGFLCEFPVRYVEGAGEDSAGGFAAADVVACGALFEPFDDGRFEGDGDGFAWFAAESGSSHVSTGYLF